MSQPNRKTVKAKTPERQKKTSPGPAEADEALIAIREQKAELDELREKLEQANREANALQVQIDDKQAKLDKTRQENRTLLLQLEQLEQENDEIKRNNQKDEHSREKLQSRLEAVAQQLKEANNRSSATVEEIRTAHQESKDENRELKREIKELRQKFLVDLPDKSLEEKGSTATSKFLVFIYDRQGKYNGRIIHLPTEDTKAFTGLAMDAIQELITKHLPRSAKEPAVFSDQIADRNGSELIHAEDLEADAPPAPAAGPDRSAGSLETLRPTPSVATMEILSATPRHEGVYIRHDEPIKVVLNLRPENVSLPGFKTLSYSINLYVRKLGGGPSKKVGEAVGTVPSAEAFPFPIETTIDAMPAGSYRLEAAVTFNAKNGEPAPASSFLEGNLFRVF